jgi:DNA-binding XRE family transcriptional regulator
MNQLIKEDNVTEWLQTLEQCNAIVTRLIEVRKEAGLSQAFMAEWLEVSRKKVNEFENGCFDFELMVKYAAKLSFNIELKMF